MKVFALDPGYERTAWVVLVDGKPFEHGLDPNFAVLDRVRSWGTDYLLAVEMIASYGMPVGREVFDTCIWIGRFVEAWERRRGKHLLVYRREVKLHLCNSAKAKDGNVRAALIDHFGPGKDRAVGVKASPGPLYGVKADVWAALGVGITAAARYSSVDAHIMGNA